ncbi:hypothetical protein PR003_g20568 [Phytophthora rubi]|uniref:Uncharacterized protein n=1 Tax=Phytophthora rubi TaxID=129364 RepID=A0A6A4DXD5_9STRA|nr:hypothetical protein PR003_g20568 [Phytophthora rubi]
MQVPARIKTETSNPTWNEADLEFRYHRKELQDFMTHNPIMQILRPTQIGDQTGPVTAPASTDNKLEAIKILMSLLWEAGLVAGTFDADDLFRPDLRIFRMSTKELFDKLKVKVGEKATNPNTTSSPDSPTQIGSTGDRTSSPFVSAAEARRRNHDGCRWALLVPQCSLLACLRQSVWCGWPRVQGVRRVSTERGLGSARLSLPSCGTKRPMKKSA